MPDHAEIKRSARAMLGRLAVFAFREVRVLARLLDADERIEAMAVARLRGGGLIGSQRIVVATDRRLILLEKGTVTGRERLRTLAWDDIADVELTTTTQRLDLVLHGGERIALQFGQPPRELGTIADLVRAQRDPLRAGTPTTGELVDLARHRLGRTNFGAAEPNVVALSGMLEPGEDVLDLALVATDPRGLLVATTSRLVFVPSRLIGIGASSAVPYAEIRGIALDGLDIEVDDGADGRRFTGVLPEERAQALVVRVSARAGAGPP